jgi:hypothetical protein
MSAPESEQYDSGQKRLIKDLAEKLERVGAVHGDRGAPWEQSVAGPIDFGFVGVEAQKSAEKDEPEEAWKAGSTAKQEEGKAARYERKRFRDLNMEDIMSDKTIGIFGPRGSGMTTFVMNVLTGSKRTDGEDSLTAG